MSTKTLQANQLVKADCIQFLRELPDSSVDLVFVDPPYNIGYDYDEYDDKQPPDQYYDWCGRWMEHIYYALKPYGSFWLMIGDEWAAELKVLAREHEFHLRSWIVWHYTFGVNCTNKFTRSHAHLFYFTKHQRRFTFNADAIRVPSARQIVYNDKRGNPEGRLPDDTWILRPQERPTLFPADSDTWYIPRIAGTFNQRVKNAPNQLPEQLLGRIIRSCSNEGDLVVDPMSGTATTLVVAKKLGRNYLGCDLSEAYVNGGLVRLENAKCGDELDGPIPQGG